MVADREVVDALAHLRDDPSALVTEQHGLGKRKRPVDDREIRVANAGGAHLDSQLAGLRAVEGQFLDGILVEIGCNETFHGGFLFFG
jgi:hypothetical protein